MIPKRSGGLSSIDLSIPTGNGELPPIPPQEPTLNEAPSSAVMMVPEGKLTPSDVVKMLEKFNKVTEVTISNSAIANKLLAKKLIVKCGDFAIVSEKGLGYLVDFTL
jgi:hypothetical protein